jgi:hypothetical protein
MGFGGFAGRACYFLAKLLLDGQETQYLAL